MAMTANYVHIKEEIAKQRMREQLDQDALLAISLPPSEKARLVFNMSETGSFEGDDDEKV